MSVKTESINEQKEIVQGLGIFTLVDEHEAIGQRTFNILGDLYTCDEELPLVPDLVCSGEYIDNVVNSMSLYGQPVPAEASEALQELYIRPQVKHIRNGRVIQRYKQSMLSNDEYVLVKDGVTNVCIGLACVSGNSMTHANHPGDELPDLAFDVFLFRTDEKIGYIKYVNSASRLNSNLNYKFSYNKKATEVLKACYIARIDCAMNLAIYPDCVYQHTDLGYLRHIHGPVIPNVAETTDVWVNIASQDQAYKNGIWDKICDYIKRKGVVYATSVLKCDATDPHEISNHILTAIGPNGYSARRNMLQVFDCSGLITDEYEINIIWCGDYISHLYVDKR